MLHLFLEEGAWSEPKNWVARLPFQWQGWVCWDVSSGHGGCRRFGQQWRNPNVGSHCAYAHRDCRFVVIVRNAQGAGNGAIRSASSNNGRRIPPRSTC